MMYFNMEKNTLGKELNASHTTELLKRTFIPFEETLHSGKPWLPYYIYCLLQLEWNLVHS